MSPIIALLVALVAGSLWPLSTARAADDDRIADLERRLEQSAQLINDLSQRVRDLEARLAPAPGAAAEAPHANDPAVEHQPNDVIATGSSQTEHSAFPIRAFADVGAGTRNQLDPDRKGFSLGSLDLYLTPELGQRTRALFELVFEVNEVGELETDLERMQIGYEFADATIWLGRFHTPYGYYNTAFHHGQQISTALRRTRFLQFEDQYGVMPAHTVGAWLSGRRRLSGGRLTYDAYLGNAQRIADRVLDLNASGTASGKGIVGGNVGFLPDGRAEGLRIGGSFFTVTVGDDAALPNRTRVNNFGLYAVYDSDRWEAITELYTFDNHDLSGATGSHHSNAAFVQAAYRLSRVAPYARYERADLAQSDSFFAAQRSGGSYDRVAAGVSFEINLATAIKLEIARTHEKDRVTDDYSEALIQYAVRF